MSPRTRWSMCFAHYIYASQLPWRQSSHVCRWSGGEQTNGWLSGHSAGLLPGWATSESAWSTSVPDSLSRLNYWEMFSWLFSDGAIRNTETKIGWCRIGSVVLILHVASAGLTDGPVVISGPYNKRHSFQPQFHYARFPPLKPSHIQITTANRTCGNGRGKLFWDLEALYAGQDRRNPVCEVKRSTDQKRSIL